MPGPFDPTNDYTDEESTVLRAMANAPRDWRVACEVEDLCLDATTSDALCRCLEARGVARFVGVMDPFDFRGRELIGVGDWVPTRAGVSLVDSVD